MEHGHIVERLSEYRDGALNAADREVVSRHLSECADCAAVLGDWERFAKAFLRRPPAPTPFQTEAFVARVTARMAEPEPAWLTRLTGRWLVPALGVSFAMLVLSFRPYAGADASDAATALLSGADRPAPLAVPAPESFGTDVLGLSSEER